ncbi:MAG: hypothetical protein HYV63_32415 [Candidatus Schekmanbacteria bacterium]|nr:hypothetical protein [Candidatus Schekmanbacteria bacterium]
MIVLDTHALLWMDGDDASLGPCSREMICEAWRGGDEELLISMADHMGTFRQLLDTCSQEEMDAPCHEYQGFHRFRDSWNVWPKASPVACAYWHAA